MDEQQRREGQRGTEEEQQQRRQRTQQKWRVESECASHIVSLSVSSFRRCCLFFFTFLRAAHR
jgi:hypothetical protein